MLSYFKVPLVFLFLGSLLGVFLRWQFISPTSGVNYSFFLHAHSHVMFLGWIFNALYIALCYNHTSELDTKLFRTLFILIQILVVAMLISFPLQGYGFYSILFSTLHTFCAIIFIIAFFTKTKSKASVSAWFARIALLFFVISTAGPFSLGYLMANGLGQSNWYYFSIYFYLHFQYNGFFLFGIFSLFFNFLDRKQIQFDQIRAKVFGRIMAVACLPAYLLSVLWAKPGLLFNFVAGLAALVQLFALYILIAIVVKCLPQIKRKFQKTSQHLLSLVLTAFAIKLLLQSGSAFPAIAQVAYALRAVVIAYLHMVLIGIISLGLFVWYIESELLSKASRRWILLFLVSFLGMEICLVVSPWRTALFGGGFFGTSESIFLFSAILSFSCLLLLLTGRKLTKIRTQVDLPHNVHGSP